MNAVNGLKFFIASSMLVFGGYQIIISQDGKFVATEASLLMAHTETYRFYRRERWHTKTRYYFQYQYKFNGKNHISQRYKHANPGLAMGVERFKDVPAGTTFTVFVNPDAPHYAVVQKGRPWFLYAMLITGLLGLKNWKIERRFEQLLDNKAPEQVAEPVRKQLVKTGGLTVIAMLVTLLMYVFAV